jgi:hypothetical protein
MCKCSRICHTTHGHLWQERTESRLAYRRSARNIIWPIRQWVNRQWPALWLVPESLSPHCSKSKTTTPDHGWAFYTLQPYHHQTGYGWKWHHVLPSSKDN